MEDAQPTTTEPAAEAPAEQAGAPVVAAPVAENDDSGTGPKVSVLVRIKSLPEAVFGYLMSDDLAKLHKTIFDKHGLSEAERDMVYYTELQVFLDDVDLQDFPRELWSRLQWEADKDEQVVTLCTDILGYIFLPAQAHLGDVAGLIVELGGDLKAFPEKQLEVRRVEFKQGAAEIAEVAELGDDDDITMRNRLAFIIESRLRHVRTDADVKEMLMRGKKTGGMAMSEIDADAIIELLNKKTRMTTYAESVSDETAAAAPPEETQYTGEEIKKMYAGTADEQEALGKRVDRFMSVTAGDPAKMRDAFYQVISPSEGTPIDPLYVVAGLICMAEGDKLSDALTEDDRYRNFIREYLSGKNRQSELADFESDPTDAKYMNILLQYFLRGVAGYDESESARLALHVINLLNKQGYNRLAELVAFDMNEGEFQWTDLVEP